MLSLSVDFDILYFSISLCDRLIPFDHKQKFHYSHGFITSLIIIKFGIKF